MISSVSVVKDRCFLFVRFDDDKVDRWYVSLRDHTQNESSIIIFHRQSIRLLLLIDFRRELFFTKM